MDAPWNSKDNASLLSLHSLYHNKWKLIASFLPNRTGSQTKNQFFNIIRTLLRKAFKFVFQRTEIFVVSQIKPKVLSEIVNQSLSVLLKRPNNFPDITVKTFLVDFVGKKYSDDLLYRESREILIAIKFKLLSVKLINKSKLRFQQKEFLSSRRGFFSGHFK